MELMSTKGHGHSLTLVQSPRFSIFKLLFRNNHLGNWNQISFEAFLGWGNKSLFRWSRSQDKDGHPLKIFSGTERPMTLKLKTLRLFDVWTSSFGSMNQYDPKFDLKINIGYCDLHFMVQWLYHFILKTSWCLNIIIWMTQSLTTN